MTDRTTTSTTVPAAAARDRAVGALVGLAVGDAVGTTLEFQPPGTFVPIDDMVGGGPFRLAPGQWTDDTSMAMCLAESILDTGHLDLEDQMRRYVAWRRDGYWASTGRCFDIGTTTSVALARFERTGSPWPDDPVDQEQAANGSLMRLAPVPIRWHHSLADAASQAGRSSTPTHPAERPVDACRVYSAMIAALIQGMSIDDVLAPTFWDDNVYGELTPLIARVARGSWRSGNVRGTGYVVAALEAAIWAVAGAADFRDAVLRAANLGDDADTTAAIAGQLAGARWGHSGIPLEWRERITDGERIAAIAGRLFDAGFTDSADKDSAATDRAVQAKAGPQTAWPHDETIHGYWIEPGAVLAGEYPGDRDSVRAAAKINLLVDNGIRTFVDLTSDRDGLTPYEDTVEQVAEQRRLPLERINFVIPDMGVRDDDGYDEIVHAIRAATARGGVYVHCWGGIGRTSTVAGCLLVDAGMGGDEALAHIARLRSSTRKAHMPAPQTQAQRDVVRQRAGFDG